MALKSASSKTAAKSSDRELRELLLLRLHAWNDPDNSSCALTSSQHDVIGKLGVIAQTRPPVSARAPQSHSVLRSKATAAEPAGSPPADTQLAPSDSAAPWRALLPPQPSAQQQSPLVALTASMMPQNGAVESTDQFFRWFRSLEEDMAGEEDAVHHKCIDQLRTCRQQCNDLLSEVTTSLELLDQLNSEYVAVKESTGSLHEACEALLTDQTHLSNQAQLIEDKLSYFQQLDTITKRLDTPSFSVTNEYFIPMLAKLDESIKYMVSNPTYRESATYLARLRHCQWRALSLIRARITSCLETATAQASAPSTVDASAASGGHANYSAIAYGKFRAHAPKVKRLVEEIESRAEQNAEYSQLMYECHQCYFQQRHLLVYNSARVAMKQLAENHRRDHCTLVRSGCAFLVHLCEDEHQMFRQFFNTDTEQLGAFLGSLCTCVEDTVRPLIMHVSHLETLAELCSILSVEMLEEHVTNNPVQLASLATAVRQLLRDVQERLVYRTHVYIQSDIVNYQPAPGDLAYPQKLIMMQDIAASLERNSNPPETSCRNTSDDDISVSSAASESRVASSRRVSSAACSPADMHGMWYPSVRRTLLCLSKLYRCTATHAFQGLSQEALAACCDSVARAADLIASDFSRTGSTVRDAQLFEIKHLLILREQIAPFQADFAVQQVSLDLAKIKDAAWDVVERRARLLSASMGGAGGGAGVRGAVGGAAAGLIELLLDSVSQHCVHTQVLDSRRRLDEQLRRVCQQLIESLKQRFTANISRLADQIERANSAPAEMPDAATVAHSVGENRKLLCAEWPIEGATLHLYLANRETEAILLKPVQACIIRQHQRLHQLCVQHYSYEQVLLISPLTAEQAQLIMAAADQPSVSADQPVIS